MPEPVDRPVPRELPEISAGCGWEPFRAPHAEANRPRGGAQIRVRSPSGTSHKVWVFLQWNRVGESQSSAE